jgi:hypothetical protein
MSPGHITLSLDDRRLIGLWAADCAARVLPLCDDTRPREAIEGIRIFGHGGPRTVHLRSLALAALAAAREAADTTASAAARAAGLAAATAYTKSVATPDHAKHALGPAVHAALARELAAGDSRAGDEELQWALTHATSAVREIVSRWPAREPGRTRLSTLFYQLDSGLRSHSPE